MTPASLLQSVNRHSAKSRRKAGILWKSVKNHGDNDGNVMLHVANAVLSSRCTALKECQERLASFQQAKAGLNKAVVEYKAASRAFLTALKESRYTVKWLEGNDPSLSPTLQEVCEWLGLVPEAVINGIHHYVQADLMLALNGEDNCICPLCRSEINK